MDRGTWRAIVHGVAKSQTQLKQLSTAQCNRINVLVFCLLVLVVLLEYNCFTILYYFLLYNEVNQLYVYIYPLPPGPPSHSMPHPTPLRQYRKAS